MIYVGVSRLSLRVGYVHSLKEKRSILNSIKAKVGSKFNVSIVEAEEQDNHKKIVLGISAVSSSKDLVEQTMTKISDFILDNFDVEIIGEEINIENY